VIFLIQGRTFIDNRFQNLPQGGPLSRYGDYFGIAPETKGKGAWIYGEYVPTPTKPGNDNWGTLIGAVT
jgi:hypothetical protein